MNSDSIQFSEREKEVTGLLLQGKSNKQIALALGISASTVEYHLKNIYRKLRVSSRTEAVLRLGKSTGDSPAGESGKSTVEMNGEIADNGLQPISTRRLPMNKMFAFTGIALLTTALVVVLVLANLPARAVEAAPTAQAGLPATQTPMPAQAAASTSSPTTPETSPLPFEYTVTTGDTCASIAANFNVSVEVILDKNNLSPACILANGQTLLIPDTGAPALPASNPPTEFFNEWLNVDLQKANLRRVSIQIKDGETYINMFGACQPTDCDFRASSPAPTVDYTYDSKSGVLYVTWTFDFETLAQELTITADGRLKITTQNHYLDNSGRADFKTVEYFAKR